MEFLADPKKRDKRELGWSQGLWEPSLSFLNWVQLPAHCCACSFHWGAEQGLAISHLPGDCRGSCAGASPAPV